MSAAGTKKKNCQFLEGFAEHDGVSAARSMTSQHQIHYAPIAQTCFQQLSLASNSATLKSHQLI